jgi:hypothetical protein
MKTLLDWGVSESLAPWALLIVAVPVMGAWALVWARRKRGLRLLVVGFILTSWILGGYSAWGRFTKPLPDNRPGVLRVAALERQPDAPLAVVVRKRGFAARGYYLPAFRSDHPVWFVDSKAGLTGWLGEQQGGFVLVRKKDGPLRSRADLVLAGRSKQWLVYRRASP